MTRARGLHSLRDLLGSAARDGFAAVMEEGLGGRLREAAAAATQELELGELRGQFEKFEGGLARFEERGRVDRSRVVAHGLRICMQLAPAAPSRGASRSRRTPEQRGVRGRPRPSPDRVTAESREADAPRGAPERPSASRAKRSRGDANLGPKTRSVGPGDDPVTVLPGVGPKIAERLAERGVARVEDLALAIPRGYRDRRSRHPIHELIDGMEATVEGVIRDFRQSWFRGRFNARMSVEAVEGEPAASLEARWFHPVGGLGQRVVTGERVLLSGAVKFFRGAPSMVHPEVSHPDAPGPAITVRYPAVEGVPAKTFAKACRAAVAHIGEALVDPIPEWLVAARELPSRLDSLRLLHDPPETLDAEAFARLADGTSPAHRRLAFDEFFMVQLAVLQQRQRWKHTSCACPPVSFDRERLRSALPFEPTAAQWRSISEIEDDLGSGEAMLRLLQGDVGSGKTAVAFAAALAVAMGGAQSALMAPTELLADQHYKTLAPWCERAGLTIASLTGSTGRAQRASRLALLEAGKIDLLIGTHALIVDDVRFHQLGLVVVDEQHRFGVEQRTRLREKGVAPHLLVMTATPIPRSLALTAFGELDVSVIDELPPGREPAQTSVFLGKRGLKSARQRLLKQVRGGLQAYVVCPLVEASEAVAASDVEQTAAELRALIEGEGEVGLIHGRLSQADKDEVMQRFRAGELRVLVATTVIEVGVDVPGARAILIEHAERFGLAQLHQLRGRVGRGQGASQCLLHTGQSKGSDAHARLLVLEQTSDGFEVAERDLKFRGPGEMFGTRQSGAMSLRFAGFGGDGLKVVVDARAAARELLERDPELHASPRLSDELARRLDSEAFYSGESG